MQVRQPAKNDAKVLAQVNAAHVQLCEPQVLACPRGSIGHAGRPVHAWQVAEVQGVEGGAALEQVCQGLACMVLRKSSTSRLSSALNWATRADRPVSVTAEDPDTLQRAR
eukprot:scaffold56420_cov19-Tisochrysis_lutea.AAC.8